MSDTFTFNIVSRWDSSRVLFAAELDATYESEPRSIQIGAAVRVALKAKADLRGANLREANLRVANLRVANLREADLREADLWGADLWGASLWGANLRGANGIANRVIDGGLRSDGYRFLLTRTESGPWRVKAGCRKFTTHEAREHWGASYRDDNLGAETRLILDHMVAVAKLRNWPEQGEERPEWGAS